MRAGLTLVAQALELDRKDREGFAKSTKDTDGALLWVIFLLHLGFEVLSRRARCHLLNHGEHEFSVAIVEAGGVAADLT